MCLGELVPIITNIVNHYLLHGHFPEAMKHAHITPLLKKPNLDTEQLKNYRPIANLSFLSKTIERAAAAQLQNYLTDNNLHGHFQSAYRKHHSVETALLRVQNDLLLDADKGQEAILVLLDYSSAFDTIDHNSMLQRLTNRYSVSGHAIGWFESYLENRTQSVVINGALSNPQVPFCGVPQGSVSGPLCFTLYTSPSKTSSRAMISIECCTPTTPRYTSSLTSSTN